MCHLQTSPYRKVAFVFACPGQAEEAAGTPCSGRTGSHLSAALEILHDLKPELFPSADRLQYLITNSWPSVEYKKKTGRYLPRISEVLVEGNLARLTKELAGVGYAICCGKHATRSVAACKNRGFRGEIISMRHLSQRSINKLGRSNIERLSNWAHYLADNLKGQS